MNNYFRRLQDKPDHHKKQFALLASGTITLFIFTFWSLAKFGVSDAIIARENLPEDSKLEEVSPIQSLQLNVASAIGAMHESFAELKASFNQTENVLDTYGR